MRVGRLCEAIETTTTDDKMLMEEVLNNTGWTSADAERIFLLQIRPAMCGSGFTGAHRHHHHDRLAHLVVHLDQADFGDATGMVELPRGDWWIFSPSYYDTTHRPMHLEVGITWFFLRVCRRGDRRVGAALRATLA